MGKSFRAVSVLLIALTPGWAAQGRAESPGVAAEVPPEVYEAVLAEALPFPQDAACEQGEPRWVVAVRSLPAWDEPESLWVFSVPWRGGPTLEVRRFKKRSLSEQLQSLQPSEREVAARRNLLRLRTTTTGSAACPQLEQLRRDFEALRLPALPENVLSLDDDHFHFWIDTCWGEPVEYKLKRVEGAFWGEVRQETHPLLVWFERLASIEAGCPRSRRP